MKRGPKSKLTDEQIAEAWARHLNGETLAAIAKDLGVSAPALHKRFGSRKEELQQMAHQIAKTEREFAELPVPVQNAVRNLADDLKDISYHLCGTAKYGAMSAHRLSQIANIQANKISDYDPLGESAQELQAFAVLTESANKAAQTGINLIKANQDAVQRLNKDSEETPSSKRPVYQVEDGRKLADA